MKIIKKFTALKIETSHIDNDLVANLIHGRESGSFYNKITPETEFDSEEDATKYAFENSSYGTWLIVPIIRFKN